MIIKNPNWMFFHDMLTFRLSEKRSKIFPHLNPFEYEMI